MEQTITHIKANDVEVAFTIKSLCGQWVPMHQLWADVNYRENVYPGRKTCTHCLDIYNAQMNEIWKEHDVEGIGII